jgi:hypothetical protein
VDTLGSRPAESSILKGLSKASSAKPALIHDVDVGGDWIASIAGECMALAFMPHDAIRTQCGPVPTIPEGDFYPSPG